MTVIVEPARRMATRRRLLIAIEPYLYAAPAVVLLAAIMLVPLALGLSYAFRDIELLNPFSGGFVGLEHFRAAWDDANFWNALRNTVMWTTVSVLLQFVFGLILALLLNTPFPGRGLVQALVFLPWAVPTFLSGLNWAWLLNPVVGPVPHWLFGLGLMSAPENILSDPKRALWGPIIAIVWWGIPFFAITLLAALQSIPRDIYEAAEIDGAGSVKRFFSITLPFLAPTIAITLLLRAVWVANAAELIVVMTNGGPADSTQIVASYIFTQAFQRLDFGYASAIAAILLVLLLAYACVVISLRQMLNKAM
jgi:multiple sugar transport system permease protein